MRGAKPRAREHLEATLRELEAAVLLGLSEDAVRSRLKRGTLCKEKAKDATVFVILGTGGWPGRPTNSTAQPTDRSTTGQPTDQSNLVEVLCDQVSFLRQHLDEEREANRENRRLIRRASAAVPELEPAQEAREAPVSSSEESEKGSRHQSSRSPHSAASAAGGGSSSGWSKAVLLVIYVFLALCIALSSVFLVLDWLLEWREEGGLDLLRKRCSLAETCRRLWRCVILRLRV